MLGSWKCGSEFDGKGLAQTIDTVLGSDKRGSGTCDVSDRKTLQMAPSDDESVNGFDNRDAIEINVIVE
jgi:hypothetical protein